MGCYLGLDKAAKADTDLVGHKAKVYSELSETMTVPFSLVITNEVFTEFIKHNNLSEIIQRAISKTDIDSKVKSFIQLSDLFRRAVFPQRIVNQLKECFELVTLDTSNLKSLANLADSHSVLALKRSTSYEDGDTICSGNTYTKDNFEDFLTILKSTYLSLFTPSSVLFRQRKGIETFGAGIIISRMPNIRTCFEAEFVSDKDTLSVSSHIGFPDSSKTVSRDKFTLAVDFLKILESDISTQETVSIFNLDANAVQVKHYSAKGSSQSATDQTILEIGRLCKKIKSQIKSEDLSMHFASEKDGKTYLLEVRTPVDIPEEKDKDSESLDLDVKDEFQSEETKELVTALSNLLKKHSNKQNALDIVIRSLDNEINSQSLSQALLSLNELIKDW